MIGNCENTQYGDIGNHNPIWNIEPLLRWKSCSGKNILLYVTATLSTKGQIVIPKQARQRRNLKPGDDLEIIVPEDTEDIVLRKIQRRANEGLLEALRQMRGLKITQRRKHFPRKPPKL